MQDKISLAGDLGSGKSTVSKILIERLGAEYYSTGSIVRSIAEKMNMTALELNKYMETHPEIDTMIDDGLRQLSLDERLLIIDSRMAWHFTAGTFKVYLSTDIETSALRIMNANRRGEHAATLEETVKDTRARRESEQKRYMTQYGVDIKDLCNYSLVVDTTNATPEQVADAIEWGFRNWQANKDFGICLLSPERINYPDDEPDAEAVSRLSYRIDAGEDIGPVTVAEREGEFYLVSDAEGAIAYAVSGRLFVPARITHELPENTKYVRMKNSI